MIQPNRSKDLKNRRLNRVIGDYTAKGYQVIENPSPEEAPALPPGFQIQAIAHGDDESVLIEVMMPEELNSAIDLPLIAQIIQDHPGWRLELVLSNPKEGIQSAPFQPSYLNRREMYVRMKEAQELLQVDHKEASLLMLCSVIAAAMVSLAHREKITLESTCHTHILKQLVFLGLISRHDYWLLRLALKLQSSITTGLQCEDLEENWLREMFEAAMRLLQA